MSFKQRLLTCALSTFLGLTLSDFSVAQTLYGSAGAQDQRENAINAEWAYNWGIVPNHNVEQSNFEFVPMIWSANPAGVQAKIDQVLALEANHGVHVDYVLGFNEPELPTQANMTVQTALNTWDVMTDSFANTDIKLVSPAVSGNRGIEDWLTPFMDEVEIRNNDTNIENDLQVDAIAYHFYSVAYNPVTEAAKLIDQIDDLWDTYQRPIWLTEFAGTSFSLDNPIHSVEERTAFNKAFLEALIPAFEERDYVERVAWWQFGALGRPYSALSTVSGGAYTPTAIGEVYAGTTLAEGDAYDLATGATRPSEVHYLKGGELTNTGSALIEALRAVDTLEGDSVIGGTADFGFELADDAFIRVRSGTTLRKQGSNTITIRNAEVDNNGDLRIEQGTMLFSGSVQFSGNGALHIGAAGNATFGSGRDSDGLNFQQPLVLDGGTLQLNSLRRPNGTHGISGSTTLQSTSTINGDGSLTLMSDVAGAGGLTKSGSGNLFLTGSNTYTGTTDVQDGTLVAASKVGSATGTGAVDVATAGRLGGYGTISGPVTVESGGTVAPGVSMGNSSAGTSSVPLPTFEEGVVVNAIDFDFTGIQDDAPLTQTSTLNDALELVSGFDFGTGLEPRNAANEGNEFNVRGFSSGSSLANAINSGDYLTFTVAPVPGLAMVVEDVTYEIRRNGSAAAKQYSVLTSIDGFEAGAELSPAAFEVTDTSRQVLTASYDGTETSNQPVEVRIYGWDASNSFGNTHFYEVSLDASFVSDPDNVAFDPTGILELGGDYTQLDFATLEIDLGGTASGEFDQLQVAGAVAIDGALHVSLLDAFSGQVGQTFDIITANSITGTFGSIIAPEGMGVEVTYLNSLVQIKLTALLPGDFNNDGIVNAADYTVWRDNEGAADDSALGGNGDGTAGVDIGDYQLWRDNFGSTAETATTAVPEPTAAILAILPLLAARRRRR